MRKKVKRKKKHHLNRLKTRKAGSSWFKLVYFDIFLLIYFRFSTIIIGSSQILVHNAQLQNSLRKFYIKC